MIEYDFILEQWTLKINIMGKLFYAYFDTQDEAKNFKKKHNDNK